MGLDKGDFNDVQKDILKEIGNIGIGSATTAMSFMFHSKLTVDFTKVLALEFDEVLRLLGGEDELAVSVLSVFEGDADGMLLFIMKKDQADNLVNMMMQTHEQIEGYSDMQQSAVKETGNIIGGSYLAALESFTGLKLRLTPPQICIDMAGAILSVPVIQFGQTGDKAFLVESSFDDEEYDINGFLLMVSEFDSYEKMCAVFFPEG
ncbi:MAG: chemotaxis protein CheC [Lachnospiraceae bacterium]|nr:chemotaxis protein CheC [Lachnospiraceae bacterium]